VKRAGAGAALLALTAVLAACSAGPKKAEDVPIGGKTRFPRHGKTIAAPAPKETLAAAEKRIAAAIVSDKCDPVYALAVLTTKTKRHEWCDQVQRLAGATATGSAEYGDQGAVIDYALKTGKGKKAKAHPIEIVAVRDADGLYHVTFVYGRTVPDLSKTKVDQAELQKSADAVTSALRKRDCVAFSKVIFTGFGPGATGDRKTICDSQRASPLPTLLAADAKLKPKLYGGNEQFAFIGYDTVLGHYTTVLARPPKDEKGPTPMTTGPYQFVRAFLTNPRPAK
jgi:hypothetical protein